MEDWHRQLEALDLAVYAAVAATPTPTLDRTFGRLSRVADHSKLWMATAALLSVSGGSRGRRAAASGLISVGLASAVVNLALKPLGARRRPDRSAHSVPLARHVEMPRSTSFPSGHAASAFAFAGAASNAEPAVGMPLHLLAGLVAYSRVHTGVHYPIDAIVGALIGGGTSSVAPRLLRAISRASGRPGSARRPQR